MEATSWRHYHAIYDINSKNSKSNFNIEEYKTKYCPLVMGNAP